MSDTLAAEIASNIGVTTPVSTQLEVGLSHARPSIGALFCPRVPQQKPNLFLWVQAHCEQDQTTPCVYRFHPGQVTTLYYGLSGGPGSKL